ncbi:MAG: Fe-S cluster assembly protein SufD [Candidatus Woesearchaeota archaeon]
MAELQLKYGLGTKFNVNLPNEFSVKDAGYKIIKGKMEKLQNSLNDSVVKKHFGRIIKSDENELTKQNTSLWKDGLFIKITKENNEVVVEQTISGDCFSRIFVHAEPNAIGIITIKTKGSGFRSEMVEIFAEENSKVKFATIQELDENSININIARAIVKRNANVDWLQANFGSKFTEAENISYLNEEGASSYHYGIFYGKNSQQIDIYSANLHNNKNTNSDIFVRAVLNNKAKAMLRGLVRIDKAASNSSGYQKEDILLLSEEAEGNSLPQLDINNHDVRCTHGATIGTVDKQHLFYLMSRGLTKEQATTMIVAGFFYPVMQRAQFGVEKKIQELIEAKL